MKFNDVVAFCLIRKAIKFVASRPLSHQPSEFFTLQCDANLFEFPSALMSLDLLPGNRIARPASHMQTLLPALFKHKTQENQ